MAKITVMWKAGVTTQDAREELHGLVQAAAVRVLSGNMRRVLYEQGAERNRDAIADMVRDDLYVDICNYGMQDCGIEIELGRADRRSPDSDALLIGNLSGAIMYAVREWYLETGRQNQYQAEHAAGMHTTVDEMKSKTAWDCHVCRKHSLGV